MAKKISEIFIVDDHELYRDLTKMILEETELVANVRTFVNGAEAINFLIDTVETSKGHPEIIFLDLSMPVMDGWEFLEEYRKLKPRIKERITIYIVTSSINPSDVEKAKKISDVSGFIIKPITQDQYSEMLSKHLETK